MKIFGFTIISTKALQGLLAVPGDRGRWWWPVVREPFAGAWQKNIEVRTDTVLTYGAVYACITRIASDIAKLRPKLVEKTAQGIWVEIDSAAFSPVLRKPNHYQNRIKFFEQWITSKLVNGNAYILKDRDERGVVIALYVLDPNRVRVLVAPNGEVYYELRRDDLSGLSENTVTVPASEIIHDTMNALYHPLCGVSPIYACGLAAMQGVRIQNNSAQFFGNWSQPGGVLSAPGVINEATAARIKEHWETNFTGGNFGRIAVLGDDLKYTPMAVNARDSLLIEQLKWTAENVCSCFGVPAYMVGVGTAPTYNNIEALNQQYYSQCLQIFIESIELCLDEGLGLTAVKGKVYGVEFDLDDLLRMDTATQVKTLGDALKGILTTNEARKKLGFVPTAGGDVVLSQQQNFSLAAIAKRDAKDDPFGSSKAPPATADPPDEGEADDAEMKTVDDWDAFRMVAFPLPRLAISYQPDASSPSP